MRNRTIRTTALTLLLALFTATALAKPPQTKDSQTKTSPAKSAPSKTTAGVTPDANVIVATVADRPITREDLIHTMQIEHSYGSKLSESEALVIVMKDVIAHEVAHSVGVDITPAETPKHFPIVDENTSPTLDRKAQEVLPAEKQAFHVDQSSYAKLYVIPKMLDRKLRKFYSTTSDLHPNEREHIGQALQLAISGKSFGEAAKTTGLATTQYELTNREIELPVALLPNLPANRNLPQRDSLFTRLNKLAAGQILPDVVEDENGFRVMRLLSRNGATYRIETIEVAKPAFESWLKERARSLPIVINDEKLKNAVKLEHPNLDWVSRLQ